jgi:hypothetical protein
VGYRKQAMAGILLPLALAACSTGGATPAPATSARSPVSPADSGQEATHSADIPAVTQKLYDEFSPAALAEYVRGAYHDPKRELGPLAAQAVVTQTTDVQLQAPAGREVLAYQVTYLCKQDTGSPISISFAHGQEGLGGGVSSAACGPRPVYSITSPDLHDMGDADAVHVDADSFAGTQLALVVFPILDTKKTG